MLLEKWPDGAEESHWINSNLHASPLVLHVALCRLHSEDEIAAPASFDMKVFVCKILLALLLLGEAKGSKALDHKKVEKVSQEIYNP